MELLRPPPELMKQLEQSRLFRSTAGKEGQPVYLAYEEHAHLDLAGEILVKGMLQDANLKGCRLDGANLAWAIANGLCLEGASLIGSDFHKGSLVEANLKLAMGQRAVFRKADLTSAQVDGADFRQACFQGVVCISASFHGTDLRGADFTHSLLKGADFSGALVAGADFSEAAFSATTRFHPADGIDQIIARRIHIDDRHFEGDEARAALHALGVTRNLP